VAAGSSADDPAQTTDDAMTRSEEEVHIHKRQRERGRARLKKYVVTDYVEKKVPVQREEVRLEYEPADRRDEAE
jgi:stress response protein YsnF